MQAMQAPMQRELRPSQPRFLAVVSWSISCVVVVSPNLTKKKVVQIYMRNADESPWAVRFVSRNIQVSSLSTVGAPKPSCLNRHFNPISS